MKTTRVEWLWDHISALTKVFNSTESLLKIRFKEFSLFMHLYMNSMKKVREAPKSKNQKDRIQAPKKPSLVIVFSRLLVFIELAPELKRQSLSKINFVAVSYRVIFQKPAKFFASSNSSIKNSLRNRNHVRSTIPIRGVDAIAYNRKETRSCRI